MGKNCDYKNKYYTWIDACEAIEEWNDRVVLSVRPMNAYWCKPHRAYHIGHQKTAEEMKEFYEIMNWHKGRVDTLPE